MVELMDPNKPAQTEAPNTEPTGWMNSAGEFGEGTPEIIQTLLDKKQWKNINQIVDGYTELEKFKGTGEHLVIPESADDVEGWNKIYGKLGVPESADKYEFTNETGVEISDELLTSFKTFAKNENYTQKQLAGAIQFQLEAVKASDEIFATQRTEREEGHIQAMRQKWQNEYEPTKIKIDSTAEKLKVKDFLKEMGIYNEPEIVNMLLTIANSDSEDPLTETGDKIVTTSLHDKLKEIMKSDAYNQRFHLDHKKAMIEYMELNQQIANSGQGQAPRT